MGQSDFDDEQKYRGGIVMIDVLSKYTVVVPIGGRTPPDIIEATKEALKKVGKKSKIIYADDERGIASQEFNDFIEDEGVELYRTRGHRAFAVDKNDTI